MTDSMDELFSKLKQNNEGGLYNNLSVLYDFIYEKHYNYQNQLNVINENACSNHEKVLEGACGTGRLSNKLYDEFDELKAFDINNGVLDIAKQRNSDINFENQDMLNLKFQNEFDIYAVMGNAIVHLIKDDDFHRFATNAYTALNEDGLLIFDCMLSKNMVNGYSGSNEFEDDEYKVKRDIVTTHIEEDLYNFSCAFKIINKNTNQTVRTGDSMKLRTYNTDNISTVLKSVGYSNIEFKSYEDYGAEIKDRIIVAKK